MIIDEANKILAKSLNIKTGDDVFWIADEPYFHEWTIQEPFCREIVFNELSKNHTQLLTRNFNEWFQGHINKKQAEINCCIEIAREINNANRR